jgi:hypothetical protein
VRGEHRQLGIENRRISGDWPGRFFARSTHGVRLLLQAAVGDQRPALPPEHGPVTPDSYAAAVDGAVGALAFSRPDPAPPLAYAAADVGLPTPEPQIVPRPLRQAAVNVASGLLPEKARVSGLRVGPVLLLDVPAEVMHHLADRWRELGGPDAEVVSLADGYLGYVDRADLAGPDQPHAERSYYGPTLAPALERGLSLVVGALREPATPATAAGH